MKNILYIMLLMLTIGCSNVDTNIEENKELNLSDFQTEEGSDYYNY